MYTGQGTWGPNLRRALYQYLLRTTLLINIFVFIDLDALAR
jgi:hypothetical protein